MRNSTRRQSGDFFQILRRVFPIFKKGKGKPPPTPSSYVPAFNSTKTKEKTKYRNQN